MRVRWLGVLLSIGLGWVALGAGSLRARDAAQRVPLVFHLALEARQPVAEQAFLARQLESANTIFEPLGLALDCVEVRRAPALPARVVTREDRDGLAALLQPGVLNVFVTATLMDVDEPGRERRGVHWRVRSAPQRHLVILSAKSGPYVLAHELGHFFGNPAHNEAPDNLMSYTQTGAVPWLDARQIARARASVRRMLAQGELKPRATGRCFPP